MTAATSQTDMPPHIRAEDLPLSRRVGAFAFVLFAYFKPGRSGS